LANQGRKKKTANRQKVLVRRGKMWEPKKSDGSGHQHGEVEIEKKSPSKEDERNCIAIGEELKKKRKGKGKEMLDKKRKCQTK